MTDLHGGGPGLMAEALVLFAAGIVLGVRPPGPLTTGLYLLVGAFVCELVALGAHAGFAVFAGTWAPAGSQMLVAVPAVLAGCSLAWWMRSGLGWAAPGAAVAAGLAAGAMVHYSIALSAACLFCAGAALGVLSRKSVVPLCCLATGASSLLAVAAFFARSGGPGPMWPVVLPLQALIVTPMAFAGGALGAWVARAVRPAPEQRVPR